MLAETEDGDVAQSGERGTRIAEVEGSNPFVSTFLIRTYDICWAGIMD